MGPREKPYNIILLYGISNKISPNDIIAISIDHCIIQPSLEKLLFSVDGTYYRALNNLTNI